MCVRWEKLHAEKKLNTYVCGTKRFPLLVAAADDIREPAEQCRTCTGGTVMRMTMRLNRGTEKQAEISLFIYFLIKFFLDNSFNIFHFRLTAELCFDHS